jgi:uncharacterized membrane protein YhhN
MSEAVLFTGLALAALLVSERRAWRLGVWVSKPLASCGFLAAALAAGATASPYGRVVLGALLLSWLGDVLLIRKGSGGLFRAGLVSFLLAHVAYAAAFSLRGLSVSGCLMGVLLLALPAFLALRWLWPQVPAGMRGPVAAYVGVISLMVALAFGVDDAARGTILGGALAFYASDLAVARERFVAKSFLNKAWGLPLYYGAQLVLAWSVAL